MIGASLWDPCPLVSICLWGMITPQLMQKVLSLVLEDLKDHASGRLNINQVQDLAGLGSNGTYANNVWVEFKKKLPQPKLPKLHVFQCPLKHSLLGLFSKPMHMILPHELLSAVYHNYPMMFQDMVYGSEATCVKFWNSVKGGEHFRNHPVRFRADHQTNCIPLRFHGDGTPVVGLGKSWGKVMDCFSLSSILVTGPTGLFYWLIYCIHQALLSKVSGHKSMAAFFKEFRWSMWWIWLGIHPTEKSNGQKIVSKLAGTKLYSCLWLLSSDCEHNTSCYGQPNVNSNKPCMLCPVNASDLPWWDFRINAEWISKIYTLLQWQMENLDECILFSVIGVSVYSLYPDWMHVKHLGVDKILLGSVLWILINWVLPESAEANLVVVLKHINEIYAQDRVKNRYGNIRQTMFTAKAGPKLKGKAGEVKDLGPVMHKIWLKYYNKELDLHKSIEYMLRVSAHLDKILDDYPTEFVLPDTAAEDLIVSGFTYMAVWADVQEQLKHHKLFGLTSKAHLLMHCCLLSRLWCYSSK